MNAQGKQDSKGTFKAPTAKMEKLPAQSKDKKENARVWELAEVEEKEEGTPRKRVKLEK
jgi:hypothetical protein